MTIHHDENDQAFYFETEGDRGELRYVKQGDVLDLTHTVVPEQLERRGYGTELVKAALGFAEDKGYKIIPSCPFVEAYFEKNPQERSLLAQA